MIPPNRDLMTKLTNINKQHTIFVIKDMIIPRLLPRSNLTYIQHRFFILNAIQPDCHSNPKSPHRFQHTTKFKILYHTTTVTIHTKLRYFFIFIIQNIIFLTRFIIQNIKKYIIDSNIIPYSFFFMHCFL